MKKILALLLAAVLVLGMVPVAVLAADDPIEITAETYAGNASVTLGGGRDYKLVADERVVIEENCTWTVCEGSTLFVYGYLDIKGTLAAEGYVTCIGNGEVTAKCWYDSEAAAYKYCTIRGVKNICGNETETVKRYFAEVHIPELSQYDGFTDPAHRLSVKYLCSRTGSEFDYLYSDLYYKTVENEDPETQSPKWYFSDAYADADADGILRVYLNQYLFLHFEFLDNNVPTKKYDGDRMAIRFNRNPTVSAQGVCARYVDTAGTVEYWPAAIVNTSGAVYNVWKDNYFLRQERIYIPTGSGYSAYGVNGEISAADQTVRLNYGSEFKFRVKIDDKYSDSAYSVYLVQGYKWNERNHEDTLEALRDEVYIDEDGNPQHYVWKFEDYKDGEQQKVYIDQYGIYHIASVEDEYTIMVTGLVSNDTLSVVGNVMDTIRNLLNAIKQFFDRVKQMLGL